MRIADDELHDVPRLGMSKYGVIEGHSKMAATTANAKRAGSTSQVWGYVIVLGAALAFVFSMYMMFFSKLVRYIDDSATAALHSTTSNTSILRAIEDDVYYCYLLPLTIPVSFLAFYANWVSLKFFRHN